MDQDKKIEEVARQVISKLIHVASDKIDPNAHFIKDLGVDSIDAIQLSVALEKNFNITIDDTVINELSTINSTVKVVSQLMK